ncbi:glycyl-radical enzyme activating protein [Treponema sp.]
MQGAIFDIQRYSTHDGPGIRSIVFFKGCPLRCAWCENPESQDTDPELLFDPKLCINCGACLDVKTSMGAMQKNAKGGVEVNPLRPRLSESQLAALCNLCPSLALRQAGRSTKAEAVVLEVMKDEAFFRKSGGGVTFSGGEPLAQLSFLLELMEAFSKLNIDMAVETCLAAPRSAVEAVQKYQPIWLVDLKHTDGPAFRRGTGGELSPILANLQFLAEQGSKIIFRVPVIPGFNDTQEALASIVQLAADLSRLSVAAAWAPHIDFLPYHDLAAGKYAALGRSYPYPSGLRVATELLKTAAAQAQDLGFTVSIGA